MSEFFELEENCSEIKKKGSLFLALEFSVKVVILGGGGGLLVGHCCLPIKIELRKSPGHGKLC